MSLNTFALGEVLKNRRSSPMHSTLHMHTVGYYDIARVRLILDIARVQLIAVVFRENLRSLLSSRCPTESISYGKQG